MGFYCSVNIYTFFLASLSLNHSNPNEKDVYLGVEDEGFSLTGPPASQSRIIKWNL